MTDCDLWAEDCASTPTAAFSDFLFLAGAVFAERVAAPSAVFLLRLLSVGLTFGPACLAVVVACRDFFVVAQQACLAALNISDPSLHCCCLNELSAG